VGKQERDKPSDAATGASRARAATPVAGIPRPEILRELSEQEYEEVPTPSREEIRGALKSASDKLATGGRRKPIMPTVTVMPRLEQVLEDGVYLLNEEIARIKRDLASGDLDGKEARIHKAIQSLVLLSREVRERDKVGVEADLTDEELREALKDE